MSWTKAQADILVRPVLRRWAGGWAHLSPTLQQALIDREIIKVVMSLQAEMISIDAIRQLRIDMLDVASRAS